VWCVACFACTSHRAEHPRSTHPVQYNIDSGFLLHTKSGWGAFAFGGELLGEKGETGFSGPTSRRALVAAVGQVRAAFGRERARD
jgi:hypothetical protein